MEYLGEVLKVGSTDEIAVKALKLRLNQVMGSTLNATDGNFGESTKAVVKQFQERNHLLDDGIVGQLTWERLFTPNPTPNMMAETLSGRAIAFARTQLFVRELTGKNDGKEVEIYLKAVGLGKGYAWCMAFVYYCFSKAAAELKIANPVPKTAKVMDCYRRAKAAYLVKGDPQPGDQGIMDFGGDTGHTFIVTKFDKKTGRVYTIEGNTSADPAYKNQDREGNGVFERNRPVKSAIAYLRYV